MDCKYCIVPQKANKFWQLVEGMALTHEQQGLLQSAFIRHVEVSPARLTWEILLETRAFIDEPLLRSISRHIAERYGQRDVIFYQKVVDLAAVLDQAWTQIVEIAAGGKRPLRLVLRQAQRRMKEGCLLVRIGNSFAGALLDHHNVADDLREAVGKVTGCACDVICETYDDEAPEKESDAAAIFQTTAYQAAARQKAASLSASNGASVAAPRSGNGRAKGRNRRGETAPGCLFGGGVAGMDRAFTEGEQDMVESTRAAESSSDFDGARFGARA